MHVDQANFVFEVKNVKKERYDFVLGDIFETDLTQFGTFDVVLCLGLMYHISKPVELLEKISAVNDDLLVIDTSLSGAKGSFLELIQQYPDSYMSAVDRPIAMKPTKQAVRDLAEHFGYSVVTLEPDFRNKKGEPAWAGGQDYRRGSRRAFICAKKTDLSCLPAEVESAQPALSDRSSENSFSRTHLALLTSFVKRGLSFKKSKALAGTDCKQVPIGQRLYPLRFKAPTRCSCRQLALHR